MPSDLDSVGATLEASRSAFRSLLAEAAEVIRARKDQQEGWAADPVGALGRELGHFADGWVDVAAIAALVEPHEGPSTDAPPLWREAEARLNRIVEAEGAGTVVVVPQGGDLRDEVRDALSEIGRLFATLRGLGRETASTGAHPFHRWSGREHAAAPPVEVRVHAGDLRAMGLGEFLEGGQKIVLRVAGAASGAPLARLASPGLRVVQLSATDGAAVLADVLEGDASAVVALFEEPGGALLFDHRPDGELEVDEDELARMLDELSDDRDRERGELMHLQALRARRAMEAPAAASSNGASAPSFAAAASSPAAPGADSATPGAGALTPPASPGAPPPSEAADRLAGWLLANTDLQPPAEG